MNDQDFHPLTFDEHIQQWHKPPPTVRNQLRPRFEKRASTTLPKKQVQSFNIRPQQQIRPRVQQPQMTASSSQKFPMRPFPRSLDGAAGALKSMVPRDYTFNADIFTAIQCPFCDKGPNSNLVEIGQVFKLIHILWIR